MITGRVVFKGSTPDSVFDKIRNYTLVFPDTVWSKISEEGIDLVKQMLAEDPDVRITAE